MPLLRWSRPLLAVALVLGGCKSNPPAPAAVDSGVVAAPVSGKAPTPTHAPAPTLGPALSYLKPVDAQHCEWLRQPLPSGEPTVFSFDAPCDESLLSWSPEGKEGLVFSMAVGEGAQPRAWRVDFTAKAGKPVDLKGLTEGTGEQGADKLFIQHVGFDTQGRLVALVSDVSAGQAFAYRLEGADWKRFETKALSPDAEGTPGIEVLDAAKARPDQTLSLFGELPGKEASEASARMLDAALPGQEPSGRWMTLATPGGPLHFRGLRDPEEDAFFPSAPVRWEQDGKLVEVEGLTAKTGERLGLQLREGLLLIFVLGEEGRLAHVLDSRTKKSLVSVKGLESATLWPASPKP
jgi:hypothetical protein